MLERYPVGARVIITEENLAALRTDCYSVAGRLGCNTTRYDKFVPLCEQGIVGEVTHNFPPGFDMSVKFGDKSFHLHQHHVTLIDRETWADKDGYAIYVVSFGTGPGGRRELTLRIPVECTGVKLKAAAQKVIESYCAMYQVREFYPIAYELKRPEW